MKILPPPPRYNDPPVYGRVMQDAVSLARSQSPRRNRVLCMAVTADDRDMGMPTTWSGAVDDICAGVLDEIPKLMFISAGNVPAKHFYSPEYAYHIEYHEGRDRGSRSGVERPHRRGLHREGLHRRSELSRLATRSPRAATSPRRAAPPSRGPTTTRRAGRSSPTSSWRAATTRAGRDRSSLDDLSMLTTILHPSGRLLDTTRDTSPATALAARYAAIIWSHYPQLWPETVRGSLSTPRVGRQRCGGGIPGEQKSVVQNCLRCYGYGVPNSTKPESRANAATLIFEGDIQPFCRTTPGARHTRCTYTSYRGRPKSSKSSARPR